ncbi:hypothetical protein CBOM_03932 [Ceraceosorus bombacis]|uniref:Uncharacterized protein n=1 Tax=Ceraceosorus bombacis TaxID=401625 RepID=A0A0P1BM33_9BASI|nr:hypothetical protein CBOM_03932 [Ceraceosorus bombacis]
MAAVNEEGACLAASKPVQGSDKARLSEVTAHGHTSDWFGADSHFLASIEDMMASSVTDPVSVSVAHSPAVDRRGVPSEKRIQPPNIDLGLVISGQMSPKRSYSQTFGPSKSVSSKRGPAEHSDTSRTHVMSIWERQQAGAFGSAKPSETRASNRSELTFSHASATDDLRSDTERAKNRAASRDIEVCDAQSNVEHVRTPSALVTRKRHSQAEVNSASSRLQRASHSAQEETVPVAQYQALRGRARRPKDDVHTSAATPANRTLNMPSQSQVLLARPVPEASTATPQRKARPKSLLSDMVEHTEMEKAALEGDCIELKRLLQTSQQELAATKALLTDEKSTLRTMLARASRLSKEAEAAMCDASKLRAEQSDLMRDLKRPFEEAKLNLEARTEQEAALAGLWTAFQKLKRGLDACKDAPAQMNLLQNMLAQEQEKAKNALYDKADLVDQLKAVRDDLDNQHKSLAEQIRSKETVSDELNQERQRFAVMTTRMEGIQAQCRSWEIQCEEKDQHLKALVADQSKLSDEIAGVLKDMRACEQYLSVSRDEAKVVQERLNAVLVELASSQEKLKTSGSECALLNAALSDAQQRVEAMTRQESTLREKLEASDNGLKVSQSSLAAAQRELGEQAVQIANLQGELNAQQQVLEARSAEATRQVASLESERHISSRLREDCNAAIQARDEARNEAAESQKEVILQQRTQAQLHANFESLRSELQESALKASNMEAQLACAKTAEDEGRRVAEVQNQRVTEASERAKTTQMKLEQAQSELTAVREELKECQGRAAQLHADRTGLANQMALTMEALSGSGQPQAPAAGGFEMTLDQDADLCTQSGALILRQSHAAVESMTQESFPDRYYAGRITAYEADFMVQFTKSLDEQHAKETAKKDNELKRVQNENKTLIKKLSENQRRMGAFAASASLVSGQWHDPEMQRRQIDLPPSDDAEAAGQRSAAHSLVTPIRAERAADVLSTPTQQTTVAPAPRSVPTAGNFQRSGAASLSVRNTQHAVISITKMPPSSPLSSAHSSRASVTSDNATNDDTYMTDTVGPDESMDVRTSSGQASTLRRTQSQYPLRSSIRRRP